MIHTQMAQDTQMAQASTHQHACASSCHSCQKVKQHLDEESNRRSPDHAASWFAVKGALFGWRDSSDTAALEPGYRQWRLQQSPTKSMLYLSFIAFFQAVLTFRSLLPVLYPSNEVPKRVLPTLLVGSAAHAIELVYTLVLILGPKRWHAHTDAITFFFDCLVAAFVSSWLLCPIPFGESFRWVVKLAFSSDSLIVKMQLVLVWCISVRAAMLQLLPPWLWLSCGLWTIMLGGCMWAADPRWYIYGEGSFGYPGCCHTLLCACLGIATAVWLEAKRCMQYLQGGKRSEGMARGGKVTGDMMAAQQGKGKERGDMMEAAPQDCAAGVLESSTPELTEPRQQYAGLQHDSKQVVAQPPSSSTQQGKVPVTQAAAQSAVMPATTQSRVDSTAHIPPPGHSITTTTSAVQRGALRPSLAALAVRAAQTSQSPAELRTALMALLGPGEADAPRPSARYRGCIQYYTADMKVDDGTGVPVRKLQKIAVSAASASGGLVGHVQYVLAPVTFPGCWRLVLTVASFGDDVRAKAGKKKMLHGPAAASVAISELDDAASVLNRRLEVALMAEGGSLLQPATFVDQSPVHVLPCPVALSAAAVQSADSRVQGWCEAEDFSLMLPRGVLLRLGNDGDCLRVVVSLSDGHEPVHEVTWTVEELRDLATDQEGDIQLPLPGLKSQQVVVEPHMLPVLVVSVMQQPRDHSRPDTLLACCPVPVLPSEQCAEMCNIFSAMVAECSDDVPADVYHDSYLPLVWDLSCALSPGSITAVVEAAGLEAYANSARDLLLFLWSHSMWHCLEAAAEQLQVLPDLTAHLVQQGGCLAVEREVLQLLLQSGWSHLRQLEVGDGHQHNGSAQELQQPAGPGVAGYCFNNADGPVTSSDGGGREGQGVPGTAAGGGGSLADEGGREGQGVPGTTAGGGGSLADEGGREGQGVPGIAAGGGGCLAQTAEGGIQAAVSGEAVAGADGCAEMLEYSPSSKPTSRQTHGSGNMGAGSSEWHSGICEVSPSGNRSDDGMAAGAAGLGDVQMPQPGLDSWVVAAKGALVGWTQSPGWRVLESRYQQYMLTQSQLAPKLLMCLDTVTSSMISHRMVTAIMWEPDIPRAAIPALYVNIMGHILTLARCAIFLLGPRRWWRYQGCITALLDFAVTTTVFVGLLLVCPLKTQECAKWMVDFSLPAEDKRTKVQVAVVFYVVMRVAMQQVPPPWLLPTAVMSAANVCWAFGTADPEWFLYATERNALSGWAAVLVSMLAGLCIVVATKGSQRLQFLRSWGKKWQ